MNIRFPKFLILIAMFIFVISFVAFWYVVQNQKSDDSQITSDSLIENDSIFNEQVISEQYAIYSAIIKDLYLDERTKLIVIDEETTGCLPPLDHEKMSEMKRQMEDFAIDKLSALLPQTINDFQNKSRQCNLLNSRFSSPIKFVIASKSDISNIFRENYIIDGWQRFSEKFPYSSGLINFSNIGFNSEMTQAFVYTGRSCGGKCGAGYYVVLQKKQNIWVVVDKVNSWVT